MSSRFPLDTRGRNEASLSLSLSLVVIEPSCDAYACSRMARWRLRATNGDARVSSIVREGDVASRRAEPSRRRRGITCRKRDVLRPTREATRASVAACRVLRLCLSGSAVANARWRARIATGILIIASRLTPRRRFSASSPLFFYFFLQ